MEILFAKLHYRIVNYLKTLKSLPEKKYIFKILKNHKYTIIFNSIFYILIPAIIIFVSELIIWLLIMLFLEILINNIPFNLIHPEWLRYISINIAEFFNMGFNNQALTNATDLKNNIGIIWLFIGSLFLWRSMLIWNIFFETGQFSKNAYQNGLMALISRIFVRCCKFSIVIMIWPIFLFAKLPNKEKFTQIQRYTHETNI